MLSTCTKWLLGILGLAAVVLLLLGWRAIDLRDDVIPLLAGGLAGVFAGVGIVLTDRRAVSGHGTAKPQEDVQALPVNAPPEAPMGMVNPWGEETVKQGEVFSYPLRGGEVLKGVPVDAATDSADADAREVPAWMRQMPLFARMAANLQETLDAAGEKAAQSPENGQESMAAADRIPAAGTTDAPDAQPGGSAAVEEAASPAAERAGEEYPMGATLSPDSMEAAGDSADAARHPEDALADLMEAGSDAPVSVDESESADPAGAVDDSALVTPWWRTRSETAPWTLGRTVFPASVRGQRDNGPAETAAEDAQKPAVGGSPAAPDPEKCAVAETTVEVMAAAGDFSIFSYPVTPLPLAEVSDAVHTAVSPDGAETAAAEPAEANTDAAGKRTDPDAPGRLHAAEPDSVEQIAPDAASPRLSDADVPRLPVDDPLDEGRGYRSLLEELAGRRLQRTEYTSADFPWAVDRTIPSRPMIRPIPLPNIFDAGAWVQPKDADEEA